MIDDPEDFHKRYAYRYYKENYDRAAEAIHYVRENMKQDKMIDDIHRVVGYYF